MAIRRAVDLRGVAPLTGTNNQQGHVMAGQGRNLTSNTNVSSNLLQAQQAVHTVLSKFPSAYEIRSVEDRNQHP